MEQGLQARLSTAEPSAQAKDVQESSKPCEPDAMQNQSEGERGDIKQKSDRLTEKAAQLPTSEASSA